MFVFAMKQAEAESARAAGKEAAGPVPFPAKVGDAKANADWLVKTFGKDLNQLPIGRREAFQGWVFKALNARAEKDGVSRQIDYLVSARYLAGKAPVLAAKVDAIIRQQTLFGQALRAGGEAKNGKDYSGALPHLAKAHKIAEKTVGGQAELDMVNRYLLDLARDARGAAAFSEKKGDNAHAAKLYRIAADAYQLRGDRQEAQVYYGRAEVLDSAGAGRKPFGG